MTAMRSNLTLLIVGGVILLGGTMKNFKVIGTTSFQIPINDTLELTTDEKADIQSLIIDYLSNKNKFVYDGSFRRESYAYPKSVSSLNGSIDGCMYNGKYIMNCGLFAQMIWMGRAVSDFKANPTTLITKAFDWGYYFDFKCAKVAYGIKKSNTAFYKDNSYITDSGNRAFITFDNAASMAQELYKMGCEISYSEADIGDLVFYRSNDISDETTDGLEQSSFRYITHVGIVYDKTDDGILTIAESSSAYSACIGKSGLGDDVTTFGNVRGAGQEQRVVMCARHPVAFGYACNVPDKFDIYKN